MVLSIDFDANALAADIEAAVTAACTMLAAIPQAVRTRRPASGGWSVQEIIGHLIDSAANNHQRFVRLQVRDRLVFPDYQPDNEPWVRLQHYQESPWDELLALWRSYNGHLARLIRQVDRRCLDRVWVLDEDRSITLGALMSDYVGHLRSHLAQIDRCLAADGAGL